RGERQAAAARADRRQGPDGGLGLGAPRRRPVIRLQRAALPRQLEAAGVPPAGGAGRVMDTKAAGAKGRPGGRWNRRPLRDRLAPVSPFWYACMAEEAILMGLLKRTYALPQQTLEEFERTTAPGKRSALVAQLIRDWLAQRKRERLRQEVIEGCREMA